MREKKRRTYRTFFLNMHFKRSRKLFILIAAINSSWTRLQISSTVFSLAILWQETERIRNAHAVAHNHIFCMILDGYEETSLLCERSSLRNHNRECVNTFLFSFLRALLFFTVG